MLLVSTLKLLKMIYSKDKEKPKGEKRWRKLVNNLTRGFFYVFGDIKSIIVAHKTKCAFINFSTRTSAELAADKVAEIGLKIKGHSLKVVWAKPKPQSNSNNSSKL